MTNIVTIIFATCLELRDILTSLAKKHQFITLESTVQKKATKKSRVSGILFADMFKSAIFCTKKEYVSIYHEYEKATNNRADKVGADHIEGGSLPYGSWDVPMLIIEHKNNYQLRYFQDMNANYKHSEYVWHYEDGTVLTAEEIDTFRKEFGDKPSVSKKQETAGIEFADQVKPRNVKFAGIIRLVVDGKVLIRKGSESREEGGSILDWHKSMA